MTAVDSSLKARPSLCPSFPLTLLWSWRCLCGGLWRGLWTWGEAHVMSGIERTVARAHLVAVGSIRSGELMDGSQGALHPQKFCN